MPEKPNEPRGRFGRRWLLVAWVTFLVVLAGCQTPKTTESTPETHGTEVPFPPATQMLDTGGRVVVSSVPAEVRLFLFTWFADRFASDPACAAGAHLARKGADQAERELLADVRDRLVEDSAGLVEVGTGGRVALSPAAVAANHADAGFGASLKALLEKTDREETVTVPLESCLDDGIWPDSMRSRRADFRAWYAEHDGRLTLRPAPGIEVVRRDAQQLIDALVVRETVLERLLRIGELERRRKFASALEEIEALAADKETTFALQVLRDAATAQRIEDKRAFLPQSAVSSECEHLRRYYRDPLQQVLPKLVGTDAAQMADAQRRVNTLEKRLSQRLTQWQADPRFAAALQRYAGDIQALTDAALAGRLTLWEIELRQVVGPMRSWEQFELLQGWLASLRDHSGPGGLAYRYIDESGTRPAPLRRTVLEQAEERLLPVYASDLSATFAAWRRFAEQQVALNLRHGLDLAVAGRVLEMVAVFPEGKLPGPLLEDVRWARDRMATSLERFSAKEAGCTIAIEPLSSATPGLGLTWARDLEAALREMLIQTGYQTFARVVPVGEEGAPAARSLTLARGRIADFSADETTETTSMREIVQYSEPKTVDDGRLRGSYAQDVIRRAIHAVTTERVAHVRVQFQIRRGEEARDVEVNRFFRKQFVQETSHPFLDMAVVETRRAERRSELQPASEPVQLRTDRIWTASEMLDWSRRLALTEMAAQVEYSLGTYALDLVSRAEKATQQGDALVAADAWGYAVAFLSRLRESNTPGPAGIELPENVTARRAEIANWQTEARKRLAKVLFEALQKQMGGEDAP
jgi:hypothetical protein